MKEEKRNNKPNWKFTFYVRQRKLNLKLNLATEGFYHRIDCIFPSDKRLPSSKEISKKTNISETTCKTHINKLTESGHILRRGRKRYLNPYLSWKGNEGQFYKYIKENNLRELWREHLTTAEKIELDFEENDIADN